MLQVDKAVVRYGSITALKGISLTVASGEIVGVIGPNGAGKTTLLHAIAGDVPVASGSILLEGVSLLGERPERIVKRGISLVPEGRHIFRRLTVAENLNLGATARTDSEAVRGDRERVLEMFPVLRQYIDTPADNLSGGEQQMLAIARALLTNPALVLMDEPSEGLAPSIVDQVTAMLATMRRAGVTVLLVEQDLHLAFAACDEIAVLDKGTIVHRAGTADFRRDEETAHRLLGV